MNYTIPLMLTLFRLVFPFFFSLMLYYLAPFNSFVINGALAVLFIVAGFTDYLDGHLARKWHQETELGRVLDPLADKVFIAGPLIALAALNKIYFYWPVLFLSRELFMSALRETSVTRGFVVPVSWWGKWKTTVQYSYIFLAIGAPWPWAVCAWIEGGALVGALALSYVSAYFYTQTFLHSLEQQSAAVSDTHEI